MASGSEGCIGSSGFSVHHHNEPFGWLSWRSFSCGNFGFPVSFSGFIFRSSGWMTCCRNKPIGSPFHERFRTSCPYSSGCLVEISFAISSVGIHLSGFSRKTAMIFSCQSKPAICNPYSVVCVSRSSSAICTAFRAAPLSRLSETTHRLNPCATVGSRRMREIKTAFSPTHSTGVM